AGAESCAVVASAFSMSPMPRSTSPPSSLNQYFTSPSGVVTTCWIRAAMDPAADFTASLEDRAFLTSFAHSSERNLTPNVASLVGGLGQYSPAPPPRLTAGQSDGDASVRSPDGPDSFAPAGGTNTLGSVTCLVSFRNRTRRPPLESSATVLIEVFSGRKNMSSSM